MEFIQNHWGEIKIYLHLFFRGVPQLFLLEGIIAISVFFICQFLLHYRKSRTKIIFYTTLMIEYLFAILCVTVLFRSGKDFPKWNLTPFWSYQKILQGHVFIIMECFFNILLFIPIGFLLCINQKLLIKSKFNKWSIILLFGASFSIFIETLQLLLHRGLCEFDDVFHNTLGNLIGYWLGKMIVNKKITKIIDRNVHKIL